MSDENGWSWVWDRFHGLDPHGIRDGSNDGGATGILGEVTSGEKQASSAGNPAVAVVPPALATAPQPDTAALLPQVARSSPGARSGLTGPAHALSVMNSANAPPPTLFLPGQGPHAGYSLAGLSDPPIPEQTIPSRSDVEAWKSAQIPKRGLGQSALG